MNNSVFRFVVSGKLAHYTNPLHSPNINARNGVLCTRYFALFGCHEYPVGEPLRRDHDLVLGPLQHLRPARKYFDQFDVHQGPGVLCGQRENQHPLKDGVVLARDLGFDRTAQWRTSAHHLYSTLVHRAAHSELFHVKRPVNFVGIHVLRSWSGFEPGHGTCVLTYIGHRPGCHRLQSLKADNFPTATSSPPCY